MSLLKKRVTSIKGIGPKISSLLAKINIFTVEDLLYHFPREYEDRTKVKTINEIHDRETVSFIGTVALIDRDRYTQNGKHITRIILKNETGFVVGVWFNQKFIRRNFRIGEKYLFFGKVSKLYGEIQILSPEYEKLTDKPADAILPVYSSTKDLSQKILRNATHGILSTQELVIDDTIPESIREKYKLCSIKSALSNIHYPSDMDVVRIAERRLKFEELLILQIGLMLEKYRMDQNSTGIKFKTSNQINDFISTLPFNLTNAQLISINEILRDMESEKQMNRLVQGDVGSGKTVVAAIALLNAVKNGYQGVLMAPTEILAAQHYQSLIILFKDININIELLSGKVHQKKREQIKEDIKNGRVDILIGTHAVIQNDVDFLNLGLVITDEQHRFGVRQRALLNKKGENPDVLVMTATPIPRTMALFIYGDLDISVINEMPPGRKKIETYAVKPGIRQRVYNFVRKEIEQGRQAYVVCPMIEESDVMDIESAVEMAEKLRTDYLKGVNIGLMHGKMKPADKEAVMTEFKNGYIKVLVSTTVIEVGINVPNATVMVVENADRFGLSTLHQLRGRVGRGQDKSYCILISDMNSDISTQRMKIMKNISDGFKIAEEDMKLRGTGEFFGTRQHGLPELKIADIFRDIEMLRATNNIAKEIVYTGRINQEEFRMLRLKTEEKFKNQTEDISFN